MLFLTATTIGVLAGSTRNLVSVAVAAFLVVAAYAAAALLGPVSVVHLVLAILGYNLGLMLLMAAVALNHALRRARISSPSP